MELLLNIERNNFERQKLAFKEEIANYQLIEVNLLEKINQLESQLDVSKDEMASFGGEFSTSDAPPVQEDWESFDEPLVDATDYVAADEEQIYTFVDVEPDFPGGYAALMAYLQKNFNYPQVAIENKIQGKAYVKFVVKSDGSIGQVQIERGIPGCPECDKEAIRVVRGMPSWKAAKVNGKNVSSVFRLPFTFSFE